MKHISIEVDDGTWFEYQSFSPETRRQFMDDMTSMAKTNVREKRTTRIKKLIAELKDGPDCNIDPETLLTLLRDED